MELQIPAPTTTTRGLDAAIRPGDGAYDAARQTFNLALDQRPAAIAYPHDAEEVAALVVGARRAGLRVAVQGGAHNAGPQGSLEDALRIRTSRMDEVVIDPLTRRARVQAGVVWDAAPAPDRPIPPAGLVERDAELSALDGAVARLHDGQGGIVLLEGPAGIGKTRLLGELRARATAAGMRTLMSRASLLERDFGCGVVRQLLQRPGDEAGAYSGAADPARAVLGDVGQNVGHGDRSFAALDGLFRLTATLTEGGPVVLCVDDLQWSDLASLRFLAYLARRLDGLPVLLAATVRTGEPATEEALMAELAQDPAGIALRPVPLSPDGTLGVVRARLGAETDAAFATACPEVTAGNPLLLGQLLSALSAEGVTPTAERARGPGHRAPCRGAHDPAAPRAPAGRGRGRGARRRGARRTARHGRPDSAGGQRAVGGRRRGRCARPRRHPA